MGPRLKVSPEDFQLKARNTQAKIVKTKGGRFAPCIYILHDGCYYYYTQTKDPLQFGDNEVEEVESALI